MKAWEALIGHSQCQEMSGQVKQAGRQIWCGPFSTVKMEWMYKKIGTKTKTKKKIVENRVVRKPVHEDQGLAIQETKADFLYIKINKFLPFNIFTALLRFIHFI